MAENLMSEIQRVNLWTDQREIERIRQRIWGLHIYVPEHRKILEEAKKKNII